MRQLIRHLIMKKTQLGYWIFETQEIVWLIDYRIQSNEDLTNEIIEENRMKAKHLRLE